jgi:hypothetical protein
MTVDLIDKQNIEFAKTTFNLKVSNALEEIGALKEAHFCRLMHNWYLADDEPGIPVDLRIQYHLAPRDWLLDDVDFSRFPPYGVYIKDIPMVLYEGLLTNIECKIQLFFGTFQDLEPRGTGVLTPSEHSNSSRVAIELLDAKLNPNRYVINHDFLKVI